MPVTADTLRAQGWSVAVHNDYRQNDVAHTFWLFTKEGRAVKGEGQTDDEALAEVQRRINEWLCLCGDPFVMHKNGTDCVKVSPGRGVCPCTKFRPTIATCEP